MTKHPASIFALMIALCLIAAACDSGTSPSATYGVSYDGNGSTSGSVPTDSIAYSPGQSAVVLGNTGSLAKTGYSFSGWNTKADGSGTAYAAGASLTIESANVVLYAGWTAAVVTTGTTAIIADHSIVADYAKIPSKYLTLVKKMWLDVPGESHSEAYRSGLAALAAAESAYAVSVTESGDPEAATDIHLRVNRATWGDLGSSSGWRYGYGEEDWYTSAAAITQTKATLDYCNATISNPISAIGFGWCWDMTWTNAPGGTVDPVFNVRWAGSSDGGPEGNKIWGLDADDTVLTGNSVCLDTYLSATQQYIDYCKAKGYSTVVFFTTGPVDGYTGENGYQSYLKQERIRNYVKEHSGTVLFDYADILCYDDGGTNPTTTSWTDTTSVVHSYPIITATNTGTGSVGHIGNAGSLRLGKAMWWMLARIAGWDGK